MPSKVIVCCKLPTGLRIEKGGVEVTLNGLNSSRIIGADHARTEVDADFWNAWKEEWKDSPLLVSGAVFEAKTQDEADKKARELEGEKTGLEPMPQGAMGVKTIDRD